MYKLGHEVEGEVVEHTHAPIFQRIATNGGGERLVAGVSKDGADLLNALATLLEGPFFILYVLHTPRGEGEPGRYQSTLVDHAELATFLERFSAFIAGDARFDLWIHSPSDGGSLVLDRHNFLYAYGPLSAFASLLSQRRFQEGELARLEGHMHYYRPEFDEDARAMLSAFEWIQTALRPADEQ